LKLGISYKDRVFDLSVIEKIPIHMYRSREEFNVKKTIIVDLDRLRPC
jgi:hypothetical protein